MFLSSLSTRLFRESWFNKINIIHNKVLKYLIIPFIITSIILIYYHNPHLLSLFNLIPTGFDNNLSPPELPSCDGMVDRATSRNNSPPHNTDQIESNSELLFFCGISLFIALFIITTGLSVLQIENEVLIEALIHTQNALELQDGHIENISIMLDDIIQSGNK